MDTYIDLEYGRHN